MPAARAPRARRSLAAFAATLAGPVAALALVLGAAAAPTAAGAQEAAPAPTATRVRMETTLGAFTIELETARAPLTSANFLEYVRAGFYDGVIFHRVINNFVAQAGGWDAKLQPKTPRAPVVNESGNGLSNRRGTVGLARTENPHSGNAQFYLNLGDNEDLDPSPLRWGYAVFGRVVEGLEVVDRIGHVPTGAMGSFERDAPLQPVVIQRAYVVGENATAAPAPAAAPTPAAPPAAPPADARGTG